MASAESVLSRLRAPVHVQWSSRRRARFVCGAGVMGLRLLRANSCNAVPTAQEEDARIPGTIFSVADEVTRLGSEGFPVQLDVRDDTSIENMVKVVMDKYGRIDVMVRRCLLLRAVLACLLWLTVRIR